MARQGIALKYLRQYRESAGLTREELAARTQHLWNGRMVTLHQRSIAAYEDELGASEEETPRRALASPRVAAAIAQALQAVYREQLGDKHFVLSVIHLQTMPLAERLREWEASKHQGRTKGGS